MNVTEHAEDRIRERCGLPKKAVEKNATLALEVGLKHSEATGRLKKYFDYLFLSHRVGANIRIYHNHVYIFTRDSKLVTVLPLPNHHKKAVQKILKRRNEP